MLLLQLTLARRILVVAFIGAASMAFAQGELASAREPVQSLHRALIRAMQHVGEARYKERYRQLNPVVTEAFNFEAVSRIALAQYWRTLPRSQKLAFIETLRDLSVATYASQFDGYAGESFRYEDTRRLGSENAIVTYLLLAPGEKPIKFQYVIISVDGRWQIVNVIVDGISDLALRRAQYRSVIEREGFDALMTILDRKIADYADD